MDKRMRDVLQVLVTGVAIAVCFLLLGEKLQLGLHRYFDADEFAYLHWGHNVFSGRLPYKDFLAYIPPAFYYVVASLFFFTDGVEILRIGRLFSFGVYCGISLSVIYLFWQLRRNLPIAIVAGVLLLFIPIPADKLIEIRPDNLAMLTILVAAIFHVAALSEKGTKYHWAAAGVFYALSLFILPKTIPQVFIGGIVTLSWWRWGAHERPARARGLRYFMVGLGTPVVLFCLWTLFFMGSWDGFQLIWYSLLRLPFEAQRISVLFPLQPYLYFYPNDLLYGAPGWNRALTVNHTIWFMGLAIGSLRLVTPFIVNGKKGVWAELLIAGAFLGYIISFIYGYPMRHEQYLIPVAIFVMFYAADAVGMVWNLCKQKTMGLFLVSIGVIALLFSLLGVSRGVQATKLTHTNAYDYALLRFVLATIPRDAYVFDLVGATIYYADPYYVSAVPFGQWEPYLSRPLPNIADELEKHGTQFIYEGGLGRINNLSAAAKTYISRTYRPVKGTLGLYGR